MRMQRIGIIIGILSGLFLGAVVLAMSLSPTTITISKPVHFFTPEGTDFLVNPGSYEVEAAGNTLRLQSPDTKEPIHILASPAPYPEDVEFPVAMAIPIPDEGIYLALAVPKAAGLEAMGSYGGIQTRGTNFLQRRKTLAAQQRMQLKTFANQFRKNPNAPEVQNQWKELPLQGQEKTSSASTADVNAIVQQVLRESYLETTKDLQFYASKVKWFNEQKKQVRERIQEIREKLAQATSAKDKETLQNMKEKLEQRLKDLEDQDQLGNFEIQRLMSQYNQAEQAAAAILKKKQDTESRVIRKID